MVNIIHIAQFLLCLQLSALCCPGPACVLYILFFCTDSCYEAGPSLHISYAFSIIPLFGWNTPPS